MENKPTILDKAIKVSIGIGLLTIALSIAYYLVIYIPQRDLKKIEAEKQLQENKAISEKNANEDIEKKQRDCLSKVGNNMKEFWNSECKAKGLKEDCLLPEFNVERYDKMKNENMETCFRLYPRS